MSDEYLVLYDIQFDQQGQGHETQFIVRDPPFALSAREVAMFRARQTAIAALPYRCSEQYNVVVLQEDPDTAWTIYLLAAATTHGEILFGGHFRASVAPDGSTVHQMQEMSRSCLEGTRTTPTDEQVDIFIVTHDLTPTPTEMHVFLSLLHEARFFVMTETGVWIVREGRISYGRPLPTEEELKSASGG